MGKRVLIFVIVWLVLSMVYFFLSEPVVKLLFPGEDNVVLWLYTLFAGLILIFVIVLFLFLINFIIYKLRKRKQKQNAQV